MTLDSIAIANRMQSQQLATDTKMVNEQVRGELAGQKTSVTLESMPIAKSLEAGKLVTETKLVNEQIRGQAAGMQQNHVAASIAVTN